MTDSRIRAIFNHPRYLEYISRNQDREQNRIFCRHDFEHGFEVARVAYIMVLERPGEHPDKRSDKHPDGAQIPKDVVYATGLLHDIARWLQYDTGADHASAGAELAVELLAEAGYTPEETALITAAIREHRQKNQAASLLGKILYLADKTVRPCRHCQVRESCNKLEEMGIIHDRYFY